MPLVIHFFLVLFYSQSCYECGLLETAWKFQNKAEFDSAIVYYHKTIEASIEQENPTYLGYAQINLGNVYGKLSLWDSSIYYNLQAYEIFSEIDEFDQQFYALINLAECHNNKGLYHTSLRYANEAHEMLSRKFDAEKLYLTSIVRGRAWFELLEYENSMNIYKEALSKEMLYSHDDWKNELLLNLANVFMANSNMDSAQNIFSAISRSAYQKGDSVKLALATHNLGIIAFKKHEFSNARKFLIRTLPIKKKVIPEKIATTYYYLGKVLLEQGMLSAAKSYLDSALVSQDFEVQIGAHEGLVVYYQLTNDYKNAFESMQLLDSLKNEQFNNERLEASKLQASIDLNQVNTQLDQQVVINENQKRMNQILMVAGLIILIIAVVLLVLFRSNFKLRKYNELLLKEQNHRVKNNLQMISSLLTLQAHGTYSNDAQQVLNESQSRINSVALLHRMLYEGNNPELVKLKTYVNSLIEEITYASPRELTINLNIEDDLALPIEKATSLGLIINELITNSLKHVNTGTDLVTSISICIVKNQIELTYHDNGKDFKPESWYHSNSFGNQLIQLQSDQLRGSFEVKNKGGFQYFLKFNR